MLARPTRPQPKLDPKAAILKCLDCCHGHNPCHDCEGLGYFETPYPTRVLREGCDTCRGEGELGCRTCDGVGSYSDPDAFLYCSACGEFIDAETSKCMACGLPWEEQP